MDLKDKIAVVTGGATGIGRAMARRFAAEGAAHVVVADLDAGGAEAVAQDISGTAMTADVGSAEHMDRLVEQVESQIGPIDLFCCNAGISVPGGLETGDADWERIWRINTLSHIYAARAVVPRMIARGGGYIVNTASAAGLLSQIGSAGYSVTKHAAVGFAEWLSITHGDDGIKVSLLCPQAVRTNMTAGMENGGVAGLDGMMEADEVAGCVVEAIRDERFLILPHEQVLTYMRRKTDDYDRWLKGMRRLNAHYGDQL